MSDALGRSVRQWRWPDTPEECVGRTVGTRGMEGHCLERYGNMLRCQTSDGVTFTVHYGAVQVLETRKANQ